MPLSRVACPSCAAGLKSAAGFAVGQKVRCPKCQTAFAVAAPEELPIEELPPEEPAPRPRPPAGKKPTRAVAQVLDDDDDRPRKKKKKKAGSYRNSPLRFAILGALLLVLGVMSYFLFLKKKKERENDRAEPDEDKIAETANAKPIRPSGAKPAEDPRDRESLNNLKQFVICMHTHAASSPDRITLPSAATRDGSGKPLLSWRVAILPYLEQHDLFKEFKQDEPWDGEHNKKLIPRMPKSYRSPRAPAPAGQTYYKVFTGPQTYFATAKPTLLPKDGASQTILIAEGGPAVPWTKPEDFAYDPKGPLPDLTPPGGGDSVAIAMGDGGGRRVSRTQVAEKSWRAAITADAGDVPGLDW